MFDIKEETVDRWETSPTFLGKIFCFVAFQQADNPQLYVPDCNFVLFFFAHVKLESSNKPSSTDGCSLRRKPLQALTLRHGGLSVLAPRQVWSQGSSPAVFLSFAGLPESLQRVEICTSHRADSSWVARVSVFSFTWQPPRDWWWP